MIVGGSFFDAFVCSVNDFACIAYATQRLHFATRNSRIVIQNEYYTLGTKKVDIFIAVLPTLPMLYLALNFTQGLIMLIYC